MITLELKQLLLTSNLLLLRVIHWKNNSLLINLLHNESIND